MKQIGDGVGLGIKIKGEQGKSKRESKGTRELEGTREFNTTCKIKIGTCLG